jgi:hypothetical protein
MGERKRRRGSGTVQAIGGVLAGFEAQVFRASKPPAELVEHAQPVRGVIGADGSLLSIELPIDDPAESAAAEPKAPDDRD